MRRAAVHVSISMKQYFKSAVRESLAVASNYWRDPLSRMEGKVVILTYHRVLAREDLEPRYVHPAMYVLNDVFDMHMQFVKKNFYVIGLDELLERWKNDSFERDQRYCVITFDDGWRDNYVHAYPILKRLGLPATIFIATNYIGTTQWFWPERLTDLLEASLVDKEKAASAETVIKRHFPDKNFRFSMYAEDRFDELIDHCKEQPSERIIDLVNKLSDALGHPVPSERVMLTWEEAREMSQDRISFGSHSCSHRILTTASQQETKEELFESQKALLQNELNYVPVFCYPNGNYNRVIQDLVKEFYQAALSAECGAESATPEDLFAIRRVGLHNDMSSTLPLFLSRLP